MAIISGMESVELDDVKPFELPVEDMAKGILARQQRADKAKEMAAMGASSLAFKVRNRQEDLDLRKQIMDEFQTDTQKLVDNAGGDWSNIENSQLQQVGIKYAMDPRTSALQAAKQRADWYQDEVAKIEATGGFAETFGYDPITQDLFNPDGSVRNLYQNNVTKKQDHVAAAHSYYKDVGHIMKEDWYARHMSDPKFGNLSKAEQEKLWYDYWVDIKEGRKTNREQIEAIMTLVENYKVTEAGKQLYNIHIRDYTKAGVPHDKAVEMANERIKQDFVQIALSKIYDDMTINGHMHFNNKPQPPSSGSPRSTGDGGGGKEKPVFSIQPGTPILEVASREGWMFSESSFDEQYRAHTDENFNIESLPADATYSTVVNLKGLRDLATSVPKRGASKKDGVAKNRSGTAYDVFRSENLMDHSNFQGHNPVAIGVMDSNVTIAGNLGVQDLKTAQALASNDLKNVSPDLLEKLYKKKLEILNQSTNKDNENPMILEREDLVRYSYKKAEELVDQRNKDLDVKVDATTRASQIAAEALKIKNGIIADGNFGSTMTSKDDNGNLVFEKSDYVTFALDESRKKLEVLTAITDKTSADKAEIEFLTKKVELLAKKDTQIDRGIELLNADYEEEKLQSNFNPTEIAMMKRFQAFKSHYSNMQRKAGIAKDAHALICHAVEISAQEMVEINNPKSPKHAAFKQDKGAFDQARLQAIGASGVDGYALAFIGSGKLDGEMRDVLGYTYDPVVLTDGSTFKFDSKQFQTIVADAIEASMNGTLNLAELAESSKALDFKGAYDPGKAHHLSTLRHSNIVKYAFYKIGIKNVEDYYSFALKNHSLVGGSPKNALVDVANLVKMYEDEVFTKDKNGSITYNGYAHEGFKQKYEKALPEKIKNQSYTDNRYKEYFKLIHQAKQPHEAANIPLYVVNSADDKAAKIGKEVETRSRNTAVGVLNSDVQNRLRDSNVKLAIWDNVGKEEIVHLDSEYAKQIIAQVQNKFQADGTLKQGETISFASILANDKMSKFRGVKVDYDSVKPLTAVFSVDTQVKGPDGNVIARAVDLEVPLDGLTVEECVALGLKWETVQYATETAEWLNKTGNTYFELTSRFTAQSENPVTESFYTIMFPMNIAGTTHPAGSVLHVKGGARNKNLYELAGSLKADEFEIYPDIDQAHKAFHKRHSDSWGSLTVAFSTIDKLKKDMGPRPLDPEGQAKWDFMVNTYAPPGMLAALVGVNYNFDNLKGRFASKYQEEQFLKNPKAEGKIGEYSYGKSEKEGGYYFLNKEGKPVTEDDIALMGEEGINEVYRTVGTLNAAKKAQAERVIAKKKYKHSDGRHYDVPEENLVDLGATGKVAEVKSADGKTTKKYPVLFTAAGTTAMVNREGTPKVDKEFQAAFQTLLNSDTSGSLQNIFTTKGPLFASSGLRSYERNIATYNKDLSILSDSEHTRGMAIDIATASDSSGSGYAFLQWCKDNQKLLEASGISVLHHAIKGQNIHIHLQYNKDKKPKAWFEDQVSKSSDLKPK